MLDSLFWPLASAIPRTAFCLSIAVIALMILTGFRVWLFYERATDLRDLSLTERAKLFWVGFRLDALVVSRGIFLLVLVVLLTPSGWMGAIRPAVLLYAGILFFFLFLAEAAGLYFFRYYDFRPNHLVLEHGLDREVLGTIAKVYPIPRILFLSANGTAAGLFAVWQLAPAGLAAEVLAEPGYAQVWDLVATFFLLLFGGFAARGTLDHRPLNPSAASVTTNRIANEIAASGIFNVLYEWAQQWQGKNTDLKSVIRVLSNDEAVCRAREYLASEGILTDDSPNPLVRLVQGRERMKPLNVVVVVLESFTSRLVGVVGGHPALTPELDRLADEAVLLENCYATGERTVQALEAVISSYPPLPGVSIVRRSQARQGFTTLANLLKERGYRTLFLYGGQGIFDHMRAFFLGNGYDVFIEEKDFRDVEFRGAWGVSDEDLFRRADREFRLLARQGQPFFATLLTVSLHSPWEYPRGRIQPLPKDVPIPAGFEYEELNNFLYADYAIGRFMQEARAAPYFDDTLFVLVGDHGVHLRGRNLIPVDEYRVPALFLAPRHLKPKRVRRVTSQMDIAPTIMEILGGSYRSPFFGKEALLHEDADRVAIMIYNKKRYGILSGRNLTVLAETGKESAYERDGAVESWQPTSLTPDQHRYSRNGIALLQLAEHLLKTGCYTTAPSKSNQKI